MTAPNGPPVETYKCLICKDTGMLHPRDEEGNICYDRSIPCQCQAETIAAERKDKLLSFCQLPKNTEHMTFDSFQTSGNPSLEESLKLAKELVEGNIRWLTLAGDVDLGKTHLSVSICRHLLSKGEPARYAFVPKLLKELRDGFQLEGEDSYRRKLDMLCTFPLLVLDDLGTEKSTEWGREQLQTIIHLRGIDGLPLVVTTNNPLDSIVGNDTEDARISSMRIASRLQRESWCRVVVLRSTEYRFRRTGS